MYLTPEKELYTIVQQYYSGKYLDIVALDLDTEFDFSNVLYDIEAHFYKVRSLVVLDKLEDAASHLAELEKRIASNTENNLIDVKTSDLLKTDVKVLNSFLDFKKLNSIDNELLSSVDDTVPSLASVYKHIMLAGTKVSVANPDLDLESYINILFSNSIADHSDIDVSKIVDLKTHYSDSLILDFAIAWLGLASPIYNDDSAANTKNSYYFFDELSSSSNTDSIKNVVNLFACHLKLGNIPEALESLKKLESMSTDGALASWNYSLLINKIALASITSDGDERSKLITEIKAQFPDSPYVADLKEKSDLFDTIIATYN